MRIAAAVAAHRATVVIAPPGSGKTTRVPPALLERGRLILLQPRRVAARSLAARIAGEMSVRLGEEVGYQVRAERCFGPSTRLLVATEGVLNRRLRGDPLLGEFHTVVLDEFHERSAHVDLALAFVAQALSARPDLRLVIMSATLDPASLLAFLGDCAVIEIDSRQHPVEIRHAGGVAPDAAVREIASRDGGHVLVFLAGVGEIRRVASGLSGRVGGATVLELHGSLSSDDQDRALRPSMTRKIVLATNIAETSLTVDGVTDVVDTGYHKVLRYDRARGLDRLERERIPEDSAAQRSGRAGRTGPGRALRLWSEGVTLRSVREPELQRVDLAAPLLEILAWGGVPASFAWYEPPPLDRVTEAMALLARLGLVVADRALTPLGEAAARLPLSPRLAVVLLRAGASREAAIACTVLSERDFLPDRAEAATTDCDVMARVDAFSRAPESLRRTARELEREARPLADGLRLAPLPLSRALLHGFPDRVAVRREPGSPRLLLASGYGAILSRASGVRDGEFLLALDLQAGERGAGSEAQVRLATRIEREWLESDGTRVTHRFDSEAGCVRASEEVLYGAIVLKERAAVCDPELVEARLAQELKRLGLGDAGERLLLRIGLAGLTIDRGELLRRGVRGRTALTGIAWSDALTFAERRRLDELAPESLAVPSGRRIALDYRADGSIILAVKLQELFGLADSPRIGPRKEPVAIELLAPNGRAVQTTRDLRSFWENTYPEVRRELRARYPRHPWPEDPWAAVPTAKTVRKNTSRPLKP